MSEREADDDDDDELLNTHAQCVICVNAHIETGSSGSC